MNVRAMVSVALFVAIAGCSSGSSDEPTTCAAMSARIAELEAPVSSDDPSWDAIQAGVDRSIERDALRAQMAADGC